MLHFVRLTSRKMPQTQGRFSVTICSLQTVQVKKFKLDHVRMCSFRASHSRHFHGSIYKVTGFQRAASQQAPLCTPKVNLCNLVRCYSQETFLDMHCDSCYDTESTDAPSCTLGVHQLLNEASVWGIKELNGVTFPQNTLVFLCCFFLFQLL